MKRTDIFLTFSTILMDGLMIFLSLILAYLIRMHWFEIINLEAPNTLIPFSMHLDFSQNISIFLIAIFTIKGVYNFRTPFQDDWNIFSQIFWVFCAGFSLVIVWFFFTQLHFFSRFIFGLAWVLGFVFLFFGRFIMQKICLYLWEKGIGISSVILISGGQIGKKTEKIISKFPRYNLVKILSENDLNIFAKTLGKFSPDEVWLACDKLQKFTTKELSHLTHSGQAIFRFFPDESSLKMSSISISELDKKPFFTLQINKIQGWGRIIKAILDRLISLIILIILSPFLLIISLLIWSEDPTADILYFSKRVGKNAKIFNCIKFRSMVSNAEKLKSKIKNNRSGGVLFKAENDPRITKTGEFLRRWSLDELPQFVNVLKGEMSLIGPRPHLPEEVKKYSSTEKYLLSIKPGITGLAQTKGKSKLSFREEMQWEMFYLQNWNLFLDTEIFFKTFFVVLKGDNS